MKKVISMVMAAAMVTSLVPATAFAAGYSYDVDATAKIVNAQNYSDGGSFNGTITGGPELWLNVNSADYSADQINKPGGIVTKFNVTLDNAQFGANVAKVSYYDDYDADGGNSAVRKDQINVPINGKFVAVGDYEIALNRVGSDNDEIEVTVQEENVNGPSNRENGALDRNDAIILDLNGITMDSHGKGRTASLAVHSDDIKISNENTDLTFASVEAKGITASTRKTVTIATDEKAELEDITIKPSVTDTFSFSAGDVIRLKPSAGFEFAKNTRFSVSSDDGTITHTVNIGTNVDEVTFNVNSSTAKRITISGLELKADTAKSGATAKIKVYATDCPAVDVEVAKVTDFTVSMTVDADADLPVIYSGVDVENTGLTDGSDHMSKEITIKESFPGAWNNAKDFTLTLPEGVYAVDHVDAKDGVQGSIKAKIDGGHFIAASGSSDSEADLRNWFGDAYAEGDYDNMVFEKRTWNESDPGNSNDEPSEITFRLQLVAAPNFEGDVTLKLEGDAVETQEVTIAKFVKPYTVKAEQNDLKIDYRRTEIPTSITITEAAPGLWDKGTTFQFEMEKISFDDDATYTVDEKSGMKIKDEGTKTGDNNDNDVLQFTVDKTSSDEAATVTLSGMSLYMERNLPAGAYALNVYSPTMEDDKGTTDNGTVNITNHRYGLNGQPLMGTFDGNTTIVKDGKVGDNQGDFYSNKIKEGFVNIITSGREDSDSFTTKVTVPVGEKYLISGEAKVDLDVPAYVSAAGYTMLPVRAVAKALGIPNENVIWNAEARTATIMYGSKIITMTIGQKTMYVNGAPVPTSAAVEIKEENGVGRAFLPMRDLGVALGVADITWDAATKTATLNGSK